MPPDPDAPIAIETTSTLNPRRLTQRELRTTVRVLFDVDVEDAALPPDGLRDGFIDNRSAPVTTLAIDRYAALAERVAEEVDLDALASCRPAEADADCLRAQLNDVGLRAMRRPIAEEDVALLVAYFDAQRAQASPEVALRRTLEAMLQLPAFLYHLDLPYPADERLLDDYALAARLSYLLFDAPPDADLLEAAARGELRDPLVRGERAWALLADPRARDGVTGFFRAWLELASPSALTKDPELYPTFDERLALAMLEETDRFVDFVVREGDGRLDTLLTGSFSFVPSALRPLYGLAESAEDEFVALDPEHRAGVLTHASVLASHARFRESSPVLRGVFAYRRLLCGELGDPPPGLDTAFPPDDPTAPMSTAARLAQHRADPACAICHDAIDPLGLAFEHYGALGEWRDDDDGLPIPPPLPLSGTDVDGPVESAVDLAHTLASSRMVQDCAVDQWLRYAGVEPREEERAALKQRFQRSGHDLADLIVATIASPAFARRYEETL